MVLDEPKVQDGKELTPAQKFYIQRVLAWGIYKRELWEIPDPTRNEIRESLKDWFRELFLALNVTHKQELVEGIMG